MAQRVPNERRRSWAVANFFVVVVTILPSTLFRFSTVATTMPALRPMLPIMRMTRLGVIGVPVFNPFSLNTLPVRSAAGVSINRL
ncbi:MAG: hypothetical protein ABSG67_08440 [Thermoguttaceae bacterium]